MRRLLLVALVGCGLLVHGTVLAGAVPLAVVGLQGTRTPDPDPPGVDSLDRAAVERLAKIELPGGASDLHSTYVEGIDYALTFCFRTTRAALPAFLAASKLPAPRPGVGVALTLPPGCPPPADLSGTDEDTSTGVYRRLMVGELGGGEVRVYVRAFTT